MLKNILSFWKGSDFLDDALSKFNKMLNNSEEMFNKVCKKLILNEDMPNLKEDIYKLDKEINGLEKDIRKRIVEHLALQPGVDLTASLMLMSVVKDAERLGDYCKNLFEVIDLLNGPLNRNKYQELFNGMDRELSEFFEETKKAFMESDEEVAALTWEHKAKISSRCDEIIEKLAKSDLPANEAVGYTLLARHFKRLSSHLVNIATSVILPIDKLDYFDEKRK